MPSFTLSSSVLSTPTPPIPLAASWGVAFSPTADRKLINMSQGVPGSSPHPMFTQRMKHVVEDPQSAKYGAILGEDSLRTSMAKVYARVYGRHVKGWGEGGVGVSKDDIGIVTGCNMAFTATIMTLCQAGDEIIVPTPWYFNHAMTPMLFAVKPVPLPTDASNGFLPSLDKLRELITPKTKAIALVSPNNPTGSVLPDSLLIDIASLCKSSHIALIIDETYRDFLPPTYTETGTTSRPSPLSDGNGVSVNSSPAPDCYQSRPHKLFEDPAWRETVISLFSFSKSFSIPGHRLGCIVAGPDFLEPASTVLDCLQINAPRPPQVAIAPILNDLQSGLTTISLNYTSLLDIFADILSRCPGWTLLSSGAFYAYVRHPFHNVSALVVGKVLATKYGVVTLPGEFFLPRREDGGFMESRELRFAVANVGEEDVRGVEERLRELKEEDFKGVEV